MWIIAAWQHISPEVTVSDCKEVQCRAVDGNDMLRNDSENGDSDTDW